MAVTQVVALAISPFSSRFIERVARATVARLPRRSLLHSAARPIEVILVGEKRMRAINRERRGQPTPTDALSFVWGQNDNLVGQLYLCPRYIKRQAGRFKISWPEEFTRSLAHGILHLAGFDHDTASRAQAMFAIQEQVVARINS